MRKIVFPQESNLQPLDYRYTALPLELEKMPPRMLNFGYLNPATCLLYDCNNKSMKMFFWSRGGVEDTRLEAKAKDTKKIRGQGQGQPFRGQTLSRPRTGMLEAKAKDQGHRAQVLSKKKKKVLTKIFQAISKKKKKKKKKVFTKIFQAISTKKRFPKNFSSPSQNFNIPKIVLSSSREQANF